MAATGRLVAAVADPPITAEQTAPVHVPVCEKELAKKGAMSWTSVTMKAAAIVISGGYGGKHTHVAQTVLYDMNGKQWRFVHLHKAARWFLQGCGGPSALKGELGAVQVLELLRAKYFGWEAADAEEAPAVAEEAPAVKEEAPAAADPMDDLDDVLAEQPVRPEQTKIKKLKERE